ncbi:MAG: site-specific integrase, partial [Clostridia bacterium]|nr:site-specific integrase [Clostridia bacterium]
MPKKSNKRRTDNRIAVQIYLGKDENGKRKYKTVYGKTQKDVDRAANDLREKMRRGIDISGDSDTFADWSTRYLAYRQASVPESTYKNDKARVKYFTDRFGSIPMRSVSAHNIQAVIDDLAAANPHTGKPTAKKTLTYIRNVAVAVFEYAIVNRALDYNPARYVKIPKNSPKSERRALTKEEQQHILDMPHRAQPAAMLAMLAGL